MNDMKQLQALLRFQLTIAYPVVIFMPLALAMPYAMQLLITTREVGLLLSSIEFLSRDLCSWLLPFLGVALLAPEAIWLGSSNLAQANGLEFLLTRAVDRRLLLRARAIVFYSVVLALPLAACLMAWKSPALQLLEPTQEAYRQVLARLPGSMAMPAPQSAIILAPGGNILLQSWRISYFLCVAVGVQVIVCFIYPLKYRGYIYWGLFAAALILPFTPYFTHASSRDGSSLSKALFFAFVAHQPLFWLGALALLILVQPWCEGRFSRAEQGSH